MAKYKIEYDPVEDKVTKTLTFMGKEYQEVWREENTCCEHPLDMLVEKDYPEIPDECVAAVEDITYAEDDEIMEYLEILTNYEQNQIMPDRI